MTTKPNPAPFRFVMNGRYCAMCAKNALAKHKDGKSAAYCQSCRHSIIRGEDGKWRVVVAP